MDLSESKGSVNIGLSLQRKDNVRDKGIFWGFLGKTPSEAIFKFVLRSKKIYGKERIPESHHRECLSGD